MKGKSAAIIGLIAFLTGAAAIYCAADYCVSDDTNALTRIVYHDFYQSEPIDLLIVGSSHSMRGVDAARMSGALGQNVFNLSTSGQDMAESYYVIREAVEKKKVDNILFFHLRVQACHGQTK